MSAVKILMGMVRIILTCWVATFIATASAQEIYKDMVLVPAGGFVMGNKASENDDERHEHDVFLDAYEMDIYEVTVEQYQFCIKEKKCEPIADIKYFEARQPIRSVSWYEAEKYCHWRGKRLPTEAEWEKAARGPDNFLSPWGSRELKDGDAAIGTGLAYVGSFNNDQSGYGIFDLAGNVEEWVADWYGKNYYAKSQQNNPKGPTRGDDVWKDGQQSRVSRGSSFMTNIKWDERYSSFATVRHSRLPNSGPPNLGFRCARSVPK